MRCADFRVFSLRVQGLQPLPPTAQVILLSRAVAPAYARSAAREFPSSISATAVRSLSS
jgi:hypothetical protein